LSQTINPQVIGDHVRRLRTKRHVSLRAFAIQTGFSASFISQLENGQVSPSLGSLQRIADTLGVTLGEFFTTAPEGDEVLVVRPAQRRRLESTWTDAQLEALGPMPADRRLEPVLAVFGPGGKSGKHPHAHAHEEFAFVVKGEATLTLADEELVLRPGDAVTLPAHAPRRWENRTNAALEILIVSARHRT
jgi:transcriptional regulator with XRE-family HTH domain